MTAFETRTLFKQLEAAVEENLDRHMAAAEDWMPHEYVPWSEDETSPHFPASRGPSSSQGFQRPPAPPWR